MNRPTRPFILFAEDDPHARLLIDYQLRAGNLAAQGFEDGPQLLAAMHAEIEVVVTDLNMPKMNGIELLQKLRQAYPLTEVILLTSVNEARTAVQALKEGAFEYLTKPFDPAELLHAVRQAQRLHGLNRENLELRQSVGVQSRTPDLVARSQRMQAVLEQVPRLARSDHTVLLTGESGTGKGVLARELHRQSRRAEGPLITVSCPAIPRDLIESELFGHEKGAFSGAINRRIGKAEMARHGTLFLDELGEMPLDLQAKLLNFLQDRFFYRVGGTQAVEADVRIIAATNRDLRAEVQHGHFREDLFYRVNVLPLELPALRERTEDIPGLAERFFSRSLGQPARWESTFTPEAQARLIAHPWPGNVRELENLMERLATLTEPGQRIDVQALPPELQETPAALGRSKETTPECRPTASFAGRTLAEIEQEAIRQTLAQCGGNKARAARMLGISEKSIYNKLKREDEPG